MRYSFQPAFNPAGAVYPVDAWLPLRLTFVNRSDAPVDGYVVLEPTSRSPGPVTRQPVFVPAHSSVKAWTYARFDTPRQPAQKIDNAYALMTCEWRSAGVVLGDKQIPILGYLQPDRNATTPEDIIEGRRGTRLLGVVGNDAPDRRSDDPSELLAIAREVSESYVTLGSNAVEDLPRDTAGYNGSRYVLFNGVNPDDLDPPQRRALLQHLGGGGVLIVADPVAANDVEHSWLAPYLPVQVVGRRLSTAIEKPVLTGTEPMPSPLKLGDPPDTTPPPHARKPVNGFMPVEVTEAVDAGGDVVLSDANFVHAASKPLGLGKVVFVSFPVGALDKTDARTNRVWTTLLEVRGSPADWDQSQLEANRVELLGHLLGRPAPPWKLAAAVAGAYLGLVVLAQLAFPGARRPLAFVGISVLAFLGCVGLLVFTWVSRGAAPVVGGRVGVVDVAADGRGVRQEQLAFVGRDDPTLGLRAAGDDVVAYPIAVDASGNVGRFSSDPPQVRPVPFDAGEAGVRAAGVTRLWQAAQALAADKTIAVSAQLDAGGIKLTADNAIGGAVRSPQLVVGESRVAAFDLPAGASSQAVAGGTTLGGDFAEGIGGTDREESIRRADILRSALTAPLSSNSVPHDVSNVDEFDPLPVLVGWLDAESSAPSLLTLYGGSAGMARVSGDVLLRARVRTAASPVGSHVKSPAAVNRLLRAPGLPQLMGVRDRQGNPVARVQSETFVIGVAPPRWAGAVRPTRMTAMLNLDAPRQTVSLRRGQLRDGKPAEVATGPEINSWSNPISPKEATFEIGPGDFDAEGIVWLRLDVQSDDLGKSATPSRWRIRSLSFDLEGDVLGPPRPPPLRRLGPQPAKTPVGPLKPPPRKPAPKGKDKKK